MSNDIASAQPKLDAAQRAIALDMEETIIDDPLLAAFRIVDLATRLEDALEVCRFLARADYDWVEDWEEARDMAGRVLVQGWLTGGATPGATDE